MKIILSKENFESKVTDWGNIFTDMMYGDREKIEKVDGYEIEYLKEEHGGHDEYSTIDYFFFRIDNTFIRIELEDDNSDPEWKIDYTETDDGKVEIEFKDEYKMEKRTERFFTKIKKTK